MTRVDEKKPYSMAALLNSFRWNKSRANFTTKHLPDHRRCNSLPVSILDFLIHWLHDSRMFSSYSWQTAAAVNVPTPYSESLSKSFALLIAVLQRIHTARDLELKLSEGNRFLVFDFANLRQGEENVYGIGLLMCSLGGNLSISSPSDPAFCYEVVDTNITPWLLASKVVVFLAQK